MSSRLHHIAGILHMYLIALLLRSFFEKSTDREPGSSHRRTRIAKPRSTHGHVLQKRLNVDSFLQSMNIVFVPKSLRRWLPSFDFNKEMATLWVRNFIWRIIHSNCADNDFCSVNRHNLRDHSSYLQAT